MNAINQKPPTRRSAGLLLHPTSLPGPYGIGDLGPSAYAWVDALVAARQTWWQVLPLGPTGYGDSPYQCFSAFGGNNYLISPEFLVRDGLIKEDDLAGVQFPRRAGGLRRRHPLQDGVAGAGVGEFSIRVGRRAAFAVRGVLRAGGALAQRFRPVPGPQG